MAATLQVYRLFSDDALPADAAGLDLHAFDDYRPDRREAGPFHGPAAARLNAGEAFVADAVTAVRTGGLRIGNPFGAGTCTSHDLVSCPSTPWTSVPLYIARFSGQEPFALVKRGLSWCTEIGVVFPRRSLLVSFQVEDRRMAQDVADVEHAERWFAALGQSAFEARDRGASPTAAAIPLTSGHFAHHIWNELSVVQAVIDAGLHAHVRLLAAEQPIAPLATLFPEIPPSAIDVVNDGPDAAMRLALQQRSAVAPAGRRHVPASLVERVLRVARMMHPEAAAAAEAFRRRHPFVLWITVRMEARTATNLVTALGALVRAVAYARPGLGVVIDGFTTPFGADQYWNQAFIAAEREVLPELASLMPGVDHVALIGQPTTEAFVWAGIVDYYVCPYGSAHHKVAWINPVPGVVHAGENKRAVSTTDAGFYVRQTGALPHFFFSPITRTDEKRDLRTDLLSYDLDVPAFTSAVLDDIAVRVP